MGDGPCSRTYYLYTSYLIAGIANFDIVFLARKQVSGPHIKSDLPLPQILFHCQDHFNQLSVFQHRYLRPLFLTFFINVEIVFKVLSQLVLVQLSSSRSLSFGGSFRRSDIVNSCPYMAFRGAREVRRSFRALTKESLSPESCATRLCQYSISSYGSSRCFKCRIRRYPWE